MSPVDAFLRSLAVGRRSRAVGVVLSGSGSDGALGVQAIKAAGGIAFAQDPGSARRDGMPLAAAATGVVDFILPPAGIAAELGGLAARLGAAHRNAFAPAPAHRTEPERNHDQHHDDPRRRILALLRAATGVDFAGYRHTTVNRRIVRRMVLTGVSTLQAYLGVLRARPLEVDTLAGDLLRRVTHFFREPEVLEALGKRLSPMLAAGLRGGTPLRIWVPGCGTGEEVYSLAIVLLEAMGGRLGEAPLQIFATDLREASLEVARAGAYLENIAPDVSPERLRLFFTQAGPGHTIAAAIRDLCVFARHDIARDPPFSRLDLICCRDVLAHLEPSLRTRILSVFHYALKPSGALALGASETLGALPQLFSSVAEGRPIYARIGVPHPGDAPSGAPAPTALTPKSTPPLPWTGPPATAPRRRGPIAAGPGRGRPCRGRWSGRRTGW